MLLAHVRTQLFVFTKLQLTAVHLTRVSHRLVRVMHASLVPDAVGVGCERFVAAVHDARERPLAAVVELVPRQVISGGE